MKGFILLDGKCCVILVIIFRLGVVVSLDFVIWKVFCRWCECYLEFEIYINVKLLFSLI